MQAHSQHRRRETQRTLLSNRIHYNVTPTVPIRQTHTHSSASTMCERQHKQRQNQCHHLLISTEEHLNQFIPVTRCTYKEPIDIKSFGRMNIKCNICAAYHWFDERLKSESSSSPVFSLCCHHGQVQLDPLPDPLEPLHTLLIS